jgi:hypothetical protein
MIKNLQPSAFRRVFCSGLEKGLHTKISDLALFLPHGTANAQQQQTAQLKLRIESGSTPQVLLDSVFTVMDRWSHPGDSLTISRQPDGGQMTASELRRTLINEVGTVPNASSHAFISYKFSFVKENFKEKIAGIQYAFKPGPGQRVDLLYLAPSGRKWARELLQKGPGFSSNANTSKPFYQRLSFLRLLETADAEILQIGGKRASEKEKEELIDRIRQAVDLSM